MGAAAVDERQQTPRAAAGGEGGHRGVGRAGRVERHQRLAGRLVPHQLHRPEGADAADLADHGVPVGDPLERRAEHLVSRDRSALEDPVVGHGLDVAASRGAGQRMPGVGQPAGIRPGAEGVDDRRRDDDAAQRHVTAVRALGEGDQIGLDGDVAAGLVAEPVAEPAETDHHLVGDPEDAVLVAERAHPGQVTGRRQHASRRPPEIDSSTIAAMVAAPRARRSAPGGPAARSHSSRRRGAEGRAVQERPEEVDDAPAPWSVGPAPRVAGEVDRRARGGAVVGAVGATAPSTPGVQPGHPDRVLDRVGAAVGEEDVAEAVAGARSTISRASRPPARWRRRAATVASRAACPGSPRPRRGARSPMLSVHQLAEKSR